MPTFQKRQGHFDEGAYATVFFSEDGRATKVFKRRTGDPDGHAQAVHSSEVEAYRIASKNALLRPLIPDFFGPISVTKIFDSLGTDITDQFFPDLAYQMSRVNGLFVKLGTLPFEQRTSIMQPFREAGIGHMNDASVVISSSGLACVIDFAVEEHELLHPAL